MGRDRIPVCPECGSANVLLDAWAQWDVDAQAYGVASTFDNGFCEDCNQDDCEGKFRHADWEDVPPKHRAGDPVAIPEKPYHITVLWGMDRSPGNEKTYKFRTQREITAFRLGIQECDGWAEYEITYTDEEYHDEP